MIRLGTVFSGIGSVEQALLRLSVEHEIAFACDNGDVDLKLFEKPIQKEYERLKARNKKLSRNPLTPEEQDRLSEIEKKELAMIHGFQRKSSQINDKDASRLYVEDLYKKYGRGKENLVQKSYFANYKIDPDDFFQDIRFLNGNFYNGKVDLLVGGSPCQSFSTVGDQHGFEDTRGTLFYEFARIVGEVQPKVFIYENVNGLRTHDKGKTLQVILDVLSQDLHYQLYGPVILNASDYGVPQTRRRMFLVGFRQDVEHDDFVFPGVQPLKHTMQDFLEDNCAFGCFKVNAKTGSLVVGRTKGHPDPKFNLTPGVQKYVLTSGTKTFRTSVATDLKIARTLVKTMTQHHRAGVDNYVTVSRDPLLLRALTDRECLRLMGYPDSFKIVVPSMAIYRQAGNSIVVDVMMAVVKKILDTHVFSSKKGART